MSGQAGEASGAAARRINPEEESVLLGFTGSSNLWTADDDIAPPQEGIELQPYRPQVGPDAILPVEPVLEEDDTPGLSGRFPQERSESELEKITRRTELFAKFQGRITQYNARTINLAKLAESESKKAKIIQAYTRGGMQVDTLGSIQKEMKGVFDTWETDVDNDQDGKSYETGALTGGLINQLGSQPASLGNYAVIPGIGYAVGQTLGGAAERWTNAGLGTLLTLATPWINATLAPGATEMSEEARERASPSVKLKKEVVNAGSWRPELVAQHEQDAQAYLTAGNALHNKFRQIVPDADPGSLTDEELQRRLNANPQLRNELDAAHAAYEVTRDAVTATQFEAVVPNKWSLEFNRDNNAWMKYTRMLRPVMTTAPALGVALGKYGAGKSVALQATAFAANLVMHIVAAALDNKNSHTAKLQAGIFNTDCLNDAGKAKRAAGSTDYTDQDVDPVPARALKVCSEEAMVQRVLAGIKDTIKQSQEPGAEPLDADLLADLTQDIAHLSGTPDLNALNKNGPAADLIEAYDGKFFSAYLAKGMKTKYNKKTEKDAQLVQRVGQTGHCLILGSGAAALFAKYYFAIGGGAANIPAGQVGMVMGVSGFAAWAGAVMAGPQIHVKDNYRDSAGKENPDGSSAAVSLKTAYLRELFTLPMMLGLVANSYRGNEKVKEKLAQMHDVAALADRLRDLEDTRTTAIGAV